MSAQLSAALAEWSSLLGPQWVVPTGAPLEEAERTTFATSQRILALLRPGNAEEVAGCLRIAQRHRVPIHPVSRGRNWGYGSRVPAGGDCVLLQLERLDRIVAYDDRLGTLTVEPGVTFEQAHRHLQAQRARFFLTTIGGPPDASLLANALERGDGRGPNADIFAHVCALEVILPTGERVETGLGRFGNSRAQHGYRWGVGPSLDGLFSQSNLGVVTRLTLWLTPRPASYREVSWALEDDAQLPPLIDALQSLIAEGTVRASAFVWNELKALSITRQYPFAQTRGRVPLPPPLLEEWRQGFGRWAGSTGLYAASPALGTALEARVYEVLEPVVSRLKITELPADGESPMLGTPSDANLAMAYWRKRTPVPASPDLDRDRCGFLWSSVAVPFVGEEASAAQGIAQRVCRMFGLEPNLALLAPVSRCLYLVSALVFDREVAGEDEKALACLKALERELAAAGYLPARLGIASFPENHPTVDDSREVLRRLKLAVDPANVLSPGRYGL